MNKGWMDEFLFINFAKYFIIRVIIKFSDGHILCVHTCDIHVNQIIKWTVTCIYKCTSSAHQQVGVSVTGVLA